MRLLVRWVVLAIAVYLAARIVGGVELDDGLVSLLVVSAILGLVNALLGTVLRILSAPLIFLTLGLFSIVINMFVLWITTLLTDRIEVDGFWSYFWASITISIVTVVLLVVLPDRRTERVR